MVNDKLVKTLLLIIGISSLQSCLIRTSMKPAMENLADRVMAVPSATARFIVDAASEIYSKDTLSDSTSAVMEKFEVKFHSKTDSFQVNIEDVKFYFVGNKLYFDSVLLPKPDVNKYADTLRSVINCFYTTPKHPETRCLTAEYTVINRNVSIHLPYKFCSSVFEPQELKKSIKK